MTEIPVSEWLAKRDAWTIYDAEKILMDLHENTPCGVIFWDYSDEVTDPFFVITYPGGKDVDLYPSTAADIYRQIEARGLGGNFSPGFSEWFVAGYILASRLSMLISGKPSTKMGRGSMFQEAIENIKEIEDAQGV